MRHGVVGNHEIPLVAVQRRAHLGRRIHALVLHAIAAALQFAQQQGGVVFGIFHQ